MSSTPSIKTQETTQDVVPWRAEETRVYTGDGGFCIRNLPNAVERAARIVEAVNSHDALRAALIELSGLLDKYWMGDRSETNIIALCAAQMKCRAALDPAK